MFIARAVCGVKHATVAALFCSSTLLCISNSDWATEKEAGRSVSVNGNEEPAGEISPIQFSCNCNYSLITHNKTPVHSTWGLLRVCAACPTPRLNLSSELHPSWEQHPRYVPHRFRNVYNTITQKAEWATTVGVDTYEKGQFPYSCHKSKHEYSGVWTLACSLYRRIYAGCKSLT